MAVNRPRLLSPAFAARVDAGRGAQHAHEHEHEHEHGHGQEHGHGHGHAHAHGHPAHAAPKGPTPRPRRATTGRSAKSRRRRGAAPSDEDEIEFPEGENGDLGVAAVGFGGDTPDGGDDQEQGGDERSRHERLGQIRQHEEEQAAAAGVARRLPPSTAGAGRRLAAGRFVAAACRLVAERQPGARTGAALRAEKLTLLQALKASPGRWRLDIGGLARVKQLLQQHAPAAKGGDAGMNLMLPMLLLNLQRLYTPEQLDEAIARLSLGGAQGRR